MLGLFHLESLIMRKAGVCFAVATLAVVMSSPPPAQAFGLRIGPFHIGLPFMGHRRHHLYMRAPSNDGARRESADVARSESAPGANSVLLYPNSALSAIFQNIFWPAASSAWPFGYQDIFAAAFAKTPPGGDARLCQQTDNSTAIVGRIRDEVTPTPDQMQLLQRLGGAIGAASGYLAKSCPNEIPAQPTARLKYMGSQIEELTMAVDMVRQPLQAFEQSLNDEQKARFAAMIDAPAATDRQQRSEAAVGTCGGSLVAIDRSIEQIDQSVQLTEAQRDGLGDVRQGLGKAASDLEAHCPTAMPPTALGRLEALQARLDSTWRAALSIQVTLADFETKLSDEQKARFDGMKFAAR
jgi:hypothetical protein